MGYASLDVIAKQSGVAIETVRRWAKEWEDGRAEETRQHIATAFEGAARTVASSIVQVGLPMVHNSLVARAKVMTEENKPLSVGEMSVVVGLMGRLSELFELAVKQGEERKPINYAPLTMDEIRQVFLEDKLFDPELIPMKEPKDVTPKRKSLPGRKSSDPDGEEGDGRAPATSGETVRGEDGGDELGDDPLEP